MTAQDVKPIKSCNEINMVGHAIVEASAGTGKTYTITGLVIRLILGLVAPLGRQRGDERISIAYSGDIEPLGIDKILLSTFTKMATEDMKKKVTQTIEQANDCFEKALLVWLSQKSSIGQTTNLKVITDHLVNIKDLCCPEQYLADLVGGVLYSYALREYRQGKNFSGSVDELSKFEDAQLDGVTYQKMQEGLLESQKNLKLALSNIDQLSVLTMHSFCQTMLRRNAFESGVLFKTDLVSDITLNRQRAENEVKRDFLYNRDLHTAADYFLYRTLDPQSINDSGIYNNQNALDDTVKILNSQGQDKFIDEERFARQLQGFNECYQMIRAEFYWPEEFVTPEIISDMLIIASRMIPNDFKIKSAFVGKLTLKSDSYSFKPKSYYTYIRTLLNNGKNKLNDYWRGEKSQLDNWVSRLKELSGNFDLWKDELNLEPATNGYSYIAFCDYIIRWQFQYATRISKVTDEIMVRRHEMSFDDLISDLAKAVGGLDHGATKRGLADSAKRLIANIRKSYPVAILDEFQDTSSSQYAIFKRVYLDDESLKCRLFIIGDPKQAIYSFRQADVYTYLKARNEIIRTNTKYVGGGIYSLNTNYRSSADVVNSVNTLFANQDHKSVFDYSRSNSDNVIRFDKSKVPDEKKSPEVFYFTLKGKSALSAGQILEEGEYEALPGLLYSGYSADNESKITKAQKSRDIARYVHFLLHQCYRAELLKDNESCSSARLDFNDQRYSIQPINPGDVAILVRGKGDVNEIKQELQKLGVIAVFLSDRHSVSDRRQETLLFKCFLDAMVNPYDDFALKSLLTCPMLLKSLDEMNRILLSSSEYSEFSLLVRHCHDLWTKGSFLTAFYHFIGAPKVFLYRRLQNRPDGMGLLTNIMHLAELIQQQDTKQPSKYAVRNWFKDITISGGLKVEEKADDENDQDKIRLETQRRVVRFITIHSSKGLEFPIVLTPFLSFSPKQSGSSRPNPSAYFYHNTAADPLSDRLMQTSWNNNPYPSYTGEQDDETMRLLYVALTRAKYINWVDVSFKEGMIGTLLFRHYKLSSEGQNSNSSAEKKGKIKEIFPDQWQEFIEKSEVGNFACKNMDELVGDYWPGSTDPATSGNAEAANLQHMVYSAEKFAGHIDRSWKITSYSSLCHNKNTKLQVTQKQSKDDELVSSDEAADIQIQQQESGYRLDRFHFPHGSASGTFLHHILEVIPFDELDEHNASPDASAYENFLHDQMQEQVNGTQSYFANSRTLKNWRSEEGIECLCHWFKLITMTPLPFGDACFSLAQVPSSQRLMEAPFTYSLGDLKLNHLNDYLLQLKAQGRWLEIPDITDTPLVRGYLTGVIDLFFEYKGKYYVLDYKSNFIDDRADAYSDESMAQKIVENRYDLQYVVYTLAAYRYLKLRIPNFSFARDFGGVLYLFLRGLPDDGPQLKAEDIVKKHRFITGAFYRNLAQLGNEFIERIDEIFSAPPEE